MATLEKRQYDGDQARLVLENEAFATALADMKEEITEQWKKSPARDTEGREKLWTMLMLLEKLEATLRTTLETGVLATQELAYQRSLIDRAKDAIGWT